MLIDGQRSTRQPRLRAIAPDDVENIIRLLREWSPRIAADEWRAIFEHPWDGERPELGYILTDSDSIVGHLGTIYSEQMLGEIRRRVCNITSWYVREDYRSSSIRLFQALLKDADIITVFTPGGVTRQIMEILGFRVLERNKYVYFPLLHAATLLRSRGVTILTDIGDIEQQLDENHRTILKDLFDTNCRHFLVREGARYCYLVTKRRRQGIKGPLTVSASEVLFCSDRAMLNRHLERILLTVLRRDATWALTGNERIVGKRRLFGLRLKHTEFVYGTDIDLDLLDNLLYSEVVLLPINECIRLSDWLHLKAHGLMWAGVSRRHQDT